MAVTSVGTQSTANLVERDQVGFAGLNSDAFMTLLITELQSQDPLDPMRNEEMLNQLSMMRNLQSNIELGETLKSITQNQQLTTAAAIIGRTVTAGTANGDVTGIVDRAFLRDGKTYLGIGDREFELGQVRSINLPS
jgi:flagellar basal-body rod modification protein FlgD